MRLLTWLVLMPIGLAVGGCSDVLGTPLEEDSAAEDDSGEGPQGASTTCDDWKTAYCKRSQNCDSATEAACKRSLEAIRCSSRAPLFRCVLELSKACAEAPVDCDPADVADVQKAQQDCRALREAYCASVDACDPATGYSLCASNLELELPCEEAYAVTTDYEVCMEELKDSTCELFLPYSCNGVILLDTTGHP